MRRRTFTFIKLDRQVARQPAKCGWCGYLCVLFDPVYMPRVGSRALGFYCSERCARFAVKVPMVVSYAAAA